MKKLFKCMLALSMVLTLLCIPDKVEAKGISATYSFIGDVVNEDGKKTIPANEVWYIAGGETYDAYIELKGLNKKHEYQIENLKASNTKVIDKVKKPYVDYGEDCIEKYDPILDEYDRTYVRNDKLNIYYYGDIKTNGSTYFTYTLKDLNTGQKYNFKSPTITYKKKYVDFHAYHKEKKGYKKADILLTGVNYDFYADVDTNVVNGNIKIKYYDFVINNKNLTIDDKSGNDVIQVRSAMSTGYHGYAKTVKAKVPTKATITLRYGFPYVGWFPTYIKQSKTFTFYSPIKTMKMNATKKTVELGKTTSLKATISPSTAYQKVSWSSSNKKVATVDKNGKIKGVGLGVATIKAKAYNGKTVTCKVTVKRPSATKVQLNTTKKTMYKGQKYTLKAKVSPAKASQSVKWSSSNSKIATVDKKGKITAKNTGTVTITAKTSNGKKAKCTVKVVKAPTKISLNHKRVTLKKGKSLTLKAAIAPKGTIKTVIWSTSNKKVATVSSKGKVTAKKKGTVYIYARSVNGKKVSCKIVVK